MIDRAIVESDGKGLGYAEAKVSRPSELRYILSVEKRDVQQKANAIVYHSKNMHRSLDRLFYPANVYTITKSTAGQFN